jgi:CTP synthase (UTP-ammonia lyase)
MDTGDELEMLNWIELVQHRIQWQALVIMMIELPNSIKEVELFDLLGNYQVTLQYQSLLAHSRVEVCLDRHSHRYTVPYL